MKNKQTHDYFIRSKQANDIDNKAHAKRIGYIQKNKGNKSRTIKKLIAYKEIITKLRIIPIKIKIRVFFISHSIINIHCWLINQSFFTGNQ